MRDSLRHACSSSGLLRCANPDAGRAWHQVALHAAATVALGVFVTWLIVRHVRSSMIDPRQATVSGRLLTAVVAGVTFLALADYVTAVTLPGSSSA